MERRLFLASIGAASFCDLYPLQLLAQDMSAPVPNKRIRATRPVPANITSGRRIDIHHHFGPPNWIKMLSAIGAIKADPWAGWHPSLAVEAMDRAGVQISFSSISSPGVYLWEGIGTEDGLRGTKLHNDVRATARDANEYGARMKADYPGRFGIWAALPLPDVDGALEEIEYALDTLKLDGVGLMTSIGQRYLGDKSFEPVFAELNRRRAIVYTHPTVSPCCMRIVPGVSPPTLEYSTDTARTIVSWISSGSVDKYPNLRWIFSHGGGTIWGSRFLERELGTDSSRFARSTKPGPRLAALRTFHYDTAAVTNFLQIRTLKTLVGTERIVFGSDNPYVNPLDIALDLRELHTHGVLDDADLRNVERENMVRLIPSLQL